MEFKLTIALDSDAMQTSGDVAIALTALAHRLIEEHGFDAPFHEFEPERLGFIRDVNGNKVGSFSIGLN